MRVDVKEVGFFKRSDGYYEVCTIVYQEHSISKIAGKDIVRTAKEYVPSKENWEVKCVRSYERALMYFRLW